MNRAEAQESAKVEKQRIRVDRGCLRGSLQFLCRACANRPDCLVVLRGQSFRRPNTTPSGVKYSYGNSQIPPPPPPPSAPPPPRAFGAPSSVTTPFAMKNEMAQEANQAHPLGEDGIDHSSLPRTDKPETLSKDKMAQSASMSPRGTPAIAQTIPLT